MRKAAAAAGGRATRENDRYWADLYDSSRLLDGSRELSLVYTDAGDFAAARYVFNSSLNVGQFTQVAELVASKYGAPNEKQGNPALGEVNYVWHLADGIVLSVSRGWPDTTTYLEYRYPENYAIMLREQQENDARKKLEQKQRQS